jgi:O-antigen ligase
MLGGLWLATAAALAGAGGMDRIGWAAAEVALFGIGLAALLGRPGRELASLPWWPLPIVLLVAAQWRLPPAAPVSVAPYETRYHLLTLVACLAGFYAAAWLAARGEARRWLVGGVVGLGALTALYGLGKYLNVHSPAYDATGPYVNRNHFAGLLEMLLPLALAVAVAGRSGREPAEGESLRWWLTRSEAQKVFLALAAAALMFAALLFSRSRMGLLSTLAALLVMGGLWVGSERGGRRRLAVASLGAALVGAAALAVWIGLDPVVARFAAGGLGDTGRLPIWSDALQLVGANLWLGTGWGTFARAYPAVQTAHLNGFVLHAHNDYLEHVVELGLPGALWLWAGIVAVYARTLRAFWRGAAAQRRAWLWGAGGSLTAILLHSLADFNLYIPANALVFSLVLGLAYGLSRKDAEVVLAGEAA